MSVVAGTRLGHYEIIELIGSGGMGEVQGSGSTAPSHGGSQNPASTYFRQSEARARFEREADYRPAEQSTHLRCSRRRATRKTDYLVMELLDGETLARRLEKGPLPLDQALRYAIEIADALDKAHRLGITHRDLKPGNIMLTRAG